MKANTIFKAMTEQVLEMLEGVTEEWEKPWVCSSNPPMNPTTKKAYEGINFLWLCWRKDKRKFNTNKWITFKQAKALKATVIKGAKAEEIIFFEMLIRHKETKKKITFEVYSKLSKENQKNFEKTPILKTFPVFNVAEVQNLPEDFYQEKRKVFEWSERNAIAENLVRSHEDLKLINRYQKRAYYSVTEDEVVMPLHEQFEIQEDYYATLFHELGHWTGAEKRLNRDSLLKVGNENYAIDELVAELTSVFMNAKIGIEVPLSRSAAYIKYWKEYISLDDGNFYKVVRQAIKAVKYLQHETKLKEEPKIVCAE
jgi:antirestriction protein ArdC